MADEPQSTIEQDVVGSVSAANMKAVGENQATANNAIAAAIANQVHQTSILANQITANAAQIANAVTARAADVIFSGQGSDLAGDISSLIAAIASGQQTTKGGQTTPPVTP